MSLLSDAAAELYSADPDNFTARRKELAAQARQAGDATAAKSIAALGKPTKAAWLVNKLVRDDPTVPERLAELGGQLRAGEAALDGATIRRLSSTRRELIGTLVKQALGPDAQRQPTLREEVTGTLNAALADPEVARQVAEGTVVRSATWAGFGPGIGTALPAATLTPPDATPRPTTISRSRKPPADPAEHERLAIARATEAATDAAEAAQAAAAVHRHQQEAVRLVEQRLHEDEDRLAQAEHSSAQAQQRLATAQRALADAEKQQADADKRLAGTRKTLAQARQQVAETAAALRQATSAQRKAAQALDSLSGEQRH